MPTREPSGRSTTRRSAAPPPSASCRGGGRAFSSPRATPDDAPGFLASFGGRPGPRCAGSDGGALPPLLAVRRAGGALPARGAGAGGVTTGMRSEPSGLRAWTPWK